MEVAANEKAEALKALAQQKDGEREEAVAEAHKVEQDIAAEKLANMEASYEKQIAELKQVIVEKLGVIDVLKTEIGSLELRKARVQRELLALREDFQNFIDSTHPFEKGKAGYMVPPVRSFNLQ